MKWVIQDNLFSEDGYVRLIDALDRLKQDYDIVKVIPFAHELTPDIDYPADQKVLVMGSDSLINVAKKKGWFPGAFTNNRFDHRVWVSAHGDEMLNAEAEVILFGDVVPPKSGESFFIRPAIDFKIFAGEVITPEKFLSWQEKAIAYGETGYSTLSADTEVVVSPVKRILQEYRFFVVNNHIVTGSSYKIGDKVVASGDVDRDVESYVHGCIQTWQPDYAYVIDIARTPDGFKIIEYNCINASGFYACDCQQIVDRLEHLIEHSRYDIRALDQLDARGILAVNW